MKVALLMGGRSGEHDVSLASGREVAGALASLGHTAFEVVFGRTGGAHWDGGEGSVAAALAAIDAAAPDVAFIAMHGPDGEDGRIQAALELIGVPYQGSGVLASAIGLDKVRAKAAFRADGLPVAPDRTVKRDATVDWAQIVTDLGLPLFLKTPASGSSVGVERIGDHAGLVARGDALRAAHGSVLIEAFLAGREFTGAVLELPDGTPTPLPVVEIRPVSARFFDYRAKYTPGATDELCPAPIDDDLRIAIQRLALRAHACLGCAGYSRTDIMLDTTDQPVILETNTLPGLTRESLLPKAAVAAGLPFDALISRLLERALR